MAKPDFAIIFTLIVFFVMSPSGWTEGTVVVTVPAKAGAVEGTTENSDVFIWRLFTGFVAPASKGNPSPVVFETWASDDDTFSTKPNWPKATEPMKLHASVLEIVKTLDGSDSPMNLRAKVIDAPGKAPVGAAAGGFPTTGMPLPA